MELVILLIIVGGIVLIYSAITGKKPQELIAQAFGGKA